MKPADVRISWMLPTIGRASLADILKDILDQAASTDQIIVVGDGAQPEAMKIAEGLDPRVIYLEEGPTKDWGHGLRNIVMPIATGTHIMSLDDDDRMARGIVPKIKFSLARRPNKPHIFRMHHEGGLVWVNKELKEGNVSTQLIAVPNIPERLGVWGNRYQGDWDFIRSTVELYPNKDKDIVWNPNVIMVHGSQGKLPPYPKGFFTP